jgi:hypothetical protein
VNNSKRRIPRIIITGVTVVLCGLAASNFVRAQPAKENWKRVYTGDVSIVEFNESSSRFEVDNILRADFRTVFSRAESTGGQSAVKYKTRLETIDFKLTERRYRFFEISLLDANGKLIQKRTAEASDQWRAIKAGSVTERLFNAASLSTPLGSWKVVAYRFAEGDSKGDQAKSQLDRLIGGRVILRIDGAEVGEKLCRSPSFEDKGAAQEEFMRELGIDWKSIGIKAEQARTINVKCAGSGWRPPQSLLIMDHSEEMLMLWEGVFLVLKRVPGEFHRMPGGGLPTLKRYP